MRFQLDPLSPTGISILDESPSVVRQANGYIGETKITGLLTAGSNVTITGNGTQQSPYNVASSGGGGSASDATTSSKGIVQLAGDLGGTAASPTTPTALHITGDETKTGSLTIDGSAGGKEVTLVSSYTGGDDNGSGTSSTTRLNLQSYQRAGNNKLGETIRNYLKRKDAKAMTAWYIPKDGYDASRNAIETDGYQAVIWTGAHYEANDHGSLHCHWEVEAVDSLQQLQGRFTVLFADPATGTVGLDKTIISTNAADFHFQAVGADHTGATQSQSLRIMGASANEKAIEWNNSATTTFTTTPGRRWRLYQNSTAEAGSNAGSDFYLSRYDDSGTFLGNPIKVTRSNGNVQLADSGSAVVISSSSAANLKITPTATGGQAVTVTGNDATTRSYQGQVTGDSTLRSVIYVDGKQEWGSGAATRDTNLYRSAADTLKTDDNLIVGTAGTVAGSAATIDGTQTLTNKSIDGSTNTITNVPIATGLSGMTNGTFLTATGATTATSVKTAPAGTVVGTSDTQTLTNKTFTASTTNFQDATDNTKKIVFDLSAISTGQTRTITWPNTGITVVGSTSTQTLTNKRVTPRVGTTASSATPTPDGDNNDQYNVTALAVGATFAAPTGTPTDGQKLMIRIKDNGSAQTLAWNAIYASTGAGTLLTTTVAGKTHLVGFIYDAAAAKWACAGADAVGY